MIDASAAVERGGLARGAIGLREVLFQAITSMAPAGAVALSTWSPWKRWPTGAR